jgi:hypothetical protein
MMVSRVFAFAFVFVLLLLYSNAHTIVPALRASKEIGGKRERVESELQTMVYASRNKMNQANNDYNVKLAIAKNNWNQRREQFEQQKLDQMLPSRRSGGGVYGSDFSRLYTMRQDNVSPFVGTCMSDIIDAVEHSAQGSIPHPMFTERFAPPPAPTANPGQFGQQQTEHMIKDRREKLAAYTNKLRVCEEDRTRAWRKMMKTKSELSGSHYQIATYNGQQRRMVVDATNHSLFPMPGLRQSLSETMPHDASRARATLPSYIPVRDKAPLPLPPRQNQSDSKYSAARIRERIGVDGTVAPVSEPKKGKDGLYLRPAGRTRKGMDWDAVRGVWIPVAGH